MKLVRNQKKVFDAMEAGYRTKEEIANHTGLSVISVRNALNKLEDKGLLTMEPTLTALGESLLPVKEDPYLEIDSLIIAALEEVRARVIIPERNKDIPFLQGELPDWKVEIIQEALELGNFYYDGIRERVYERIVKYFMVAFNNDHQECWVGVSPKESMPKRLRAGWDVFREAMLSIIREVERDSIKAWEELHKEEIEADKESQRIQEEAYREERQKAEEAIKAERERKAEEREQARKDREAAYDAETERRNRMWDEYFRNFTQNTSYTSDEEDIIFGPKMPVVQAEIDAFADKVGVTLTGNRKKDFKRLAWKCHPDREGGNKALMQELNDIFRK